MTDYVTSCVFLRNNVLEIPNCLYWQITHSAGPHTLTPPDMPPEVFSQSPGPEQIQGNVQYYTECMERPSISYRAREQQTWFQKTNKATTHSTTPLLM